MSRESEIRALLTRHGFRFSKSMGQNFLIDPLVPSDIAAGARPDSSTHVLEIGPGIGALTSELCREAGFVSAIELDKMLLPMLGETMAEYTNYEIIQGDALKINIAEVMASRPDLPRKVVAANLPYNITGPVITALLECGVFESLTIMIQREVAHRIAAKPGGKEYGAFTLFVRYHADSEILFDVPPDAFMPAPKVTSSVIRLTPHAPSDVIEDRDFFFRVIKAAFAQRRKTLANTLKAGGFGLSGEAIAAILEQCGIEPMARGETLGLEEFAQLAREIRAAQL